MGQENDSSAGFSGRTRRRTTRRGVVLADLTARILISIGGIGTILAVTGVCLFLVAVVIPLFTPADVSEPRPIEASFVSHGPMHVGIDEYRVLGWALQPDGSVEVFRLDNGSTMRTTRPFEGAKVTAVSFPIMGDYATVGFEDGSVRVIRPKFKTTFLDPESVPESVKQAFEKDPHAAIDHEQGVVQLTQQGQYRKQEFEIVTVRSAQVSPKPIRLLGQVSRTNGPLICAISGEGEQTKLFAIDGVITDDFLTGKKTIQFNDAVELPFENLTDAPPIFVGMSGSGTDIYVAWADGRMMRLKAHELSEAFVYEKGRLTEPGVGLTHVGFILSNNTLIWGDEQGRIDGGFQVRLPHKDDAKYEQHKAIIEENELAETWRHPDAQNTLLRTKSYVDSGPKMTSMAPSGRSRIMLCGFDDGTVQLYGTTGEGRLANFQVPAQGAITNLVFTPKEDGLLAVTAKGAYAYDIDPKYPEVTFKSLFTRVWYEGYPKPEHSWQSSSGHTGFEAKFGLIPLVFGTLKATFFAMLFGAPLALLAAVYSSEFLHSKPKAVLKPTIELMASLPSVVLGFVAALVFAPYIEELVPATLAVFLAVPLSFLIGSYVWQILPQRHTIRLQPWRPLFFVIPMAAGMASALVLGPWLEIALFGGSVKSWLQWTPGPDSDLKFANPFPGWWIILLPVSGVIVATGINRTLTLWLRRNGGRWSRPKLAWIDFGKFGGGLLLTVIVSAFLAGLLSLMGIDPRGPWTIWGVDLSFLGTYEQRNSLIVGMFMGFAIIPIIYTIADDALTAVPEHLRSASLGAGATPWQTAVNIVIPTAMSGLFSALMIGLGRAVGETMIVLMATGNTPVLDLNIFNGSRTLSANIAVELPEAPKGAVHYRTLFLAALVLFVMTFAVNTVAEVIRLKFRKRAFQL